jgi:16S rRNA (uracil1498-N3)-methyltransferase
MRIHRVYWPQPANTAGEIEIQGQTARHLIRVLRSKTGQQIILFDGQGAEYLATVTAVSRQQVTASISSTTTVDRESPVSVTLIQGISRGERMDWLLQKATELGVHQVIPVYTRRSVVRLDNKRLKSRMAHWQGIITHACEQSGRNILPKLCSPQALVAALDRFTDDHRYYLDPESHHGFGDMVHAHELTLIIGPEGGFDREEKQLMNDRQVLPVKLGPRILRTETAGMAALAAIGVLWGDL